VGASVATKVLIYKQSQTRHTKHRRVHNTNRSVRHRATHEQEHRNVLQGHIVAQALQANA